MSHARLRAIAAAGKGYWGYDPQGVAGWVASIEFPPEEHVLEAGCVRVEWEAEPNAIGSYERLGAVPVSERRAVGVGPGAGRDGR